MYCVFFFLLHMVSSRVATWLCLAGGWLWMECARRLFSNVRYFSALPNGHFLFVWIVTVSSQHGVPRVTGFHLWCLGYKGNVLRGAEAEAADFLRSYVKSQYHFSHILLVLAGHKTSSDWWEEEKKKGKTVAKILAIF